MTILEDIVQRKKLEVERKKNNFPLEKIMQSPMSDIRNFKDALQKDGISIIAEIKKKSPSAGLIREDFDPQNISLIYEKNEASAISVLTDSFYFGGKNEYLTQVKNKIQIPVLRKEFIIDSYQIYESCLIGADAILLIASILEKQELIDFQCIAKKFGLHCLVEVHTEEELDKVLEIDPEIIGINNRDLKSFNVDMKTSFKLRKKIPDQIITVSESGIDNREDVYLLEESGFDAVLIGETLMRAKDIGFKLKSLLTDRDSV